MGPVRLENKIHTVEVLWLRTYDSIEDLNAPTTWMLRQLSFLQLACCHHVNLCHFPLNGDYLQWQKCDIRNYRSRGELPESSFKLVKKVHTGPVNGCLRVHCAAPSFAYYSRDVSSKSFTGFFTLVSVWRWKAQDQISFMCLYKVNQFLFRCVYGKLRVSRYS
jgi:hypothetical protein